MDVIIAVILITLEEMKRIVYERAASSKRVIRESHAFLYGRIFSHITKPTWKTLSLRYGLNYSTWTSSNSVIIIVIISDHHHHYPTKRCIKWAHTHTHQRVCIWILFHSGPCYCPLICMMIKVWYFTILGAIINPWSWSDVHSSDWQACQKSPSLWLQNARQHACVFSGDQNKLNDLKQWSIIVPSNMHIHWNSNFCRNLRHVHKANWMWT